MTLKYAPAIWIMLALLCSCKKEEENDNPKVVVITNVPTEIGYYKATLNGDYNAKGQIIQGGGFYFHEQDSTPRSIFKWRWPPSPYSWTVAVKPGTKYYYKAYLVAKYTGVSQGWEESFVTPTLPDDYPWRNRLASLPSPIWKSSVFTVNNTGYALTEDDNANTVFLEYNVTTNRWREQQKTTGSHYGTYFLLGNKVYSVNRTSKECWEYDLLTNQWDRKADYPGNDHSFAFAIAQNGFVGIGNRTEYGTGQPLASELWQYDPDLNEWLKKAAPPGLGFQRASFTAGNKAYVGMGGYVSESVYSQQFWEYDSEQDAWNRKKEFPGAAVYPGVTFSLYQKGYVGLGKNPTNDPVSELWQYDPAFDSWTKQADFPGLLTIDAKAFVVNNSAYLTEDNGTWQFSPVR